MSLAQTRGVPISSKVAEELAPSLTESDQKVISFINDVVTPNSSQINPPYPNGSAEVSDLINKLGEKVCYGELTAEDNSAFVFAFTTSVSVPAPQNIEPRCV